MSSCFTYEEILENSYEVYVFPFINVFYNNECVRFLCILECLRRIVYLLSGWRETMIFLLLKDPLW